MKVSLGEYKGFEINRPEINVSDEDVHNAIEVLRGNYKKFEEKDGKVEAEDHLTINYEAYYDGEIISEISRNNHNFKIGEGLFHENFENALYGKAKGDQFTVTVKMDRNFGLRYLRNEQVTFEVQLVSISRRIVPELTDEIVKTFKLEGITTVEELKSEMKYKLQTEKVKTESINILNDMMKRIIDNSRVELDSGDVEALKYEILEDFKEYLKKNNASLDLYIKETGKSEEEVIELCKEEARTYLTEKSVIEKIGHLENIVLTTEESSGLDDEDRLRIYCEKVVSYLLSVNTK